MSSSTNFDVIPIASASVAQVHRAKLKATGEPLAIKVRRPSIARWAELDRSIILGIAHGIELIPSMRMVSPVESARQFCDAINRQLDFRREAANNLRFRANFAGESYVVFPRVYENLSSERVLTMEFVEGYRERDLSRGRNRSEKSCGPRDARVLQDDLHRRLHPRRPASGQPPLHARQSHRAVRPRANR